MVFTGNIHASGPIIVAFFIALAIGFNGYEQLKGYVFTMMILAPAVFGPMMNITGSILASYWHKKTPKGYLPSLEQEVL
tara:strand:- start:33026 stop:33262 length:237 start_codon:yes stop_codon:yes gene_type:complete